MTSDAPATQVANGSGILIFQFMLTNSPLAMGYPSEESTLVPTMGAPIGEAVNAFVESEMIHDSGSGIIWITYKPALSESSHNAIRMLGQLAALGMLGSTSVPSASAVNVTLVNTLNTLATMHTVSSTSDFVSILQIIGNLGGVYTIVEGLFTIIFGRTLMAMFTGGKVISPFGMTALFLRKRLWRGIDNQYPLMSEDLSRPGLSSYIKDVALDAGFDDAERGLYAPAGAEAIRTPWDASEGDDPGAKPSSSEEDAESPSDEDAGEQAEPPSRGGESFELMPRSSRSTDDRTHRSDSDNATLGARTWRRIWRFSGLPLF